MTAFFILANAYNLFGSPLEDNVVVLFVVLQVILLGLAYWVDGNRVGGEII